MKRRISQKVEQWRSQPEHVRRRISMRLTWVAGIGMGALWLVVFLPFQLYISRDHTEKPAVQGTTSVATPTPTPTIDPFSNS